MDIISILKILGDKNRLRIINILRETPLCVCEIQYLLKIHQSNTSRHLKKLKSSHFIVFQKKRQRTYYSFNFEVLKDFSFLESLLIDGLKKDPVFMEDINQLQKYKDSNLSPEDLSYENLDL